MLLPVRTSPPAVPVFTADEAVARLHLHLDTTENDALVDLYIASATVHLEDLYGLAFITQTIQWDVSCFGGTQGIRLTRSPVQSIESVSYYVDGETDLTVLDSAEYIMAGNVIRLASGSTWPEVYDREDAIRVEYVAGFGDTPEEVPASIRHAILLLVAQAFEQREVTTAETVNELPFSVRALMSSYHHPIV